MDGTIELSELEEIQEQVREFAREYAKALKAGAAFAPLNRAYFDLIEQLIRIIKDHLCVLVQQPNACGHYQYTIQCGDEILIRGIPKILWQEIIHPHTGSLKEVKRENITVWYWAG